MGLNDTIFVLKPNVLIRNKYFSCAFFHGQIEQPVRGLMSLINHKDVSVSIGVNTEGVYILDPVENVIFFYSK